MKVVRMLAIGLAAGMLRAALHAQVADPGTAPAPPGGGQPGLPAYTLHANSRIVLTDVTVTDREGRPVKGLPASAFHVRDNGKPQSIASFEEHTAAPSHFEQAAAAEPGNYSNDYLLHLPPVLNVLVLDITNIELVDQMYLYQELVGFVRDLPGGEPLAVYFRKGTATVLLQGFTAEKNLLLEAIRKAIPQFPPHGRQYLSDWDTLHQIAFYLSQVPGRKNVLWFSGGSTAALRTGPAPTRAAQRLSFDELEASRIAVYPIDARGLTEGSSRLLNAQHYAMGIVAEATGGTAFFSNNGLKQIASTLVSNDGSFYALSYTPRDFHEDDSWHKVTVAVDGDGYRISYRQGYYADGVNAHPYPPGAKRPRILADGTTEAPPDVRSAPILFEAHVAPTSAALLQQLPPGAAALPGKPRRGRLGYSIVYSVRAADFVAEQVRGEQRVLLGVEAVAFDHNGEPVGHRSDRFTITINPAALARKPDSRLLVEQPIEVSDGDDYLYLAVWDLSNGRIGTLETPFAARKPASSR